MQIYSKKKVTDLVIQELVRQGLENKKQHFNMLTHLEKLMSTKKKPVYLISFTAEHRQDGYETAKALHSLLVKNNVNAILMPCAKERDISVVEIKGE